MYITDGSGEPVSSLSEVRLSHVGFHQVVQVTAAQNHVEAVGVHLTEGVVPTVYEPVQEVERKRQHFQFRILIHHEADLNGEVVVDRLGLKLDFIKVGGYFDTAFEPP